MLRFPLQLAANRGKQIIVSVSQEMIHSDLWTYCSNFVNHFKWFFENLTQMNNLFTITN